MLRNDQISCCRNGRCSRFSGNAQILSDSAQELSGVLKTENYCHKFLQDWQFCAGPWSQKRRIDAVYGHIGHDDTMIDNRRGRCSKTQQQITTQSAVGILQAFMTVNAPPPVVYHFYPVCWTALDPWSSVSLCLFSLSPVISFLSVD